MSDKPVKFYGKDKEHQKAEKLLQEQNLGDDGGIKYHLAIDEASDRETDDSASLKKQSKGGFLRRLFWPALSAFVITAAGYEAIQFINSLMSTHWLLGSAVGVLAGAAVISGGYMLIKGWQAKYRFKKRRQQQVRFEEIQQKNSYGKAAAPLNELTLEIGQYVDMKGLKQKYQRQKQQVHNDKELIQIYSDTVLKGLDKIALDAITKHATEAAAMVAISPLAIGDMALVAWRGSKMIEEVSQIYGCPQTALSRFEMTKKIFKNMMLAGASDLVADASVEFLGKGLTATISTKAAQGIGVGMLIARMGLQNMQLCRPVAFSDDNKPRLGDIRKSIYSKVAGLIKSISTSGKSVEKKTQGKL
ncbi:TIGR01620 family protein [Kangiella sediminilitoris]|uniref:TIGR01620 family protein n=1 Tax=Kangiella sediminilitoris TaxID=1144748 RepID=A0A1B3B993_9GAMM|nr:TIGR01620 family protein [Kangiella sediminilitoris]AOE49362.1 hypothetical protein KS2013_638 [Kangiella sediminilitoris]